MIDCIEIETSPWQNEIEIGEAAEMEMTLESGLCIDVEAEPSDGSEIHLILADIVDEVEADETPYDFEMEFSEAPLSLVYVGPVLPAVEVEWSTDAWFRSDGWFGSEAW